MSVVKGMTMCFLSASTTTGRKKLLPDDVKIPQGYNIKELTRLGTKTVFDQKALRPFVNIRKQAQSNLDMIGVRHGGGWLIPDTRLNEVDKMMEEFSSKYHEEKFVLINNYEDTLKEWLERIEELNADLAEIISSNVISRDYLMSQITFNFSREEEEVKHIVSNLVTETASAAKNAIDKLVGKGTVTKLDRRSLAYITNIRDKLDSMVFLNPSIEPTVDRINSFLSSIPKRESLGIEWYQKLIMELTFLSDPDNYKILQTATTITVEQGVIDILDNDSDIQNAIQGESNDNPVEQKAEIVDTEQLQPSNELEGVDQSIIDSFAEIETTEAIQDLDVDSSILEQVEKEASGGWF